MKTWDAFYPKVAVYAPDIMLTTVVDEAKQASIDFFTESRCWRGEDTAIGTTAAGQSAYAITNPANQDAVGFPATWIGGKEIGEFRPDDKHEIGPEETGTARGIRWVDATHFELLPVPTESGLAITGSVAYAPSDTATGLEDALFSLHWRTIVHKICANLLMHNGRSYSNPQMAAWHSGEYDRLALDAGSAAGARSRRPLRVKLSPV